MNTKFVEKFFRTIFAFVFVVGTVWLPTTSVGASPSYEPFFAVSLPNEYVDVQGYDWPLGALVTITIDELGYTDTQTAVVADWDPSMTVVNFPIPGVTLEPNQHVTMTYGVIIKEHTITNVTVTNVNVEDETATGTADPGTNVWVLFCDDSGCPEDHNVTADGSGHWNTTFSDIEIGDHVIAHQFDDDTDHTAYDWRVTSPHFTVFPEWEWFDGLDWPDGATVTITVAGKPECETSKESWGYFFNGSFGDGCNLVIGDTVTFTDGATIRTHTVQNLAVTKANQDDNTISGTADPGAEVYVWPHATGEQQLAIAKIKGAAKGKWHVDFSGIYDLTPGECGRSEIRDEFANSTAVDWCISNPRIVASESGDWFWTTEFKPGDLDIYIYDSPDEGASLLWSGQQVADESGFAFVGSDIHGLDLLPGNYLVISDGDNQKSVVLQPISVTMFDTQYDFMAGFAPAGSEVWAAVGPQDWQERIMVTANPDTGAWFANFAYIGFDITEDMQPWSYAHIYDEDGDANEGNTPPSQDNAIVIANHPDWVDSGITVNAGQTFTIEAIGLMNPCSDTYPNGSEICIFYIPVGGDWAVPYENDFGIFPGPGLPFMALLGRIGDGEPFYVGQGGTFIAEQDGTLWFTPNDNLRTDNQGAYSVQVWLEPQE